ncbi:unnamed protein product [Kuraishia capsulata CBS 1993]|uniref:V-type proton ATPase subunit a n=1 Tax=Kuraishia capsulata CBS 1993 TaxID=1382522 RepID=W6MHF7_9ASCO|nr:uncharacterized protein KUCA_T00001654001 [Kuraishia capsulata CBS 1993]CDK25684.1 unnamed protein product [Kuraishia capsulata CBS 1993]
MSLIQLYIPTEISKESVYALGTLGLIQFRDLNKKINAFQRTFISEIRRLDNVERQYRFLKGEMDSKNIEMVELAFGQSSNNKFTSRNEIDELVEDAQILEDRIAQLKESSESLLKKQVDLLQLQQVLIASDGFFSQTDINPDLIDLGEDAAAILENGGFRDQSFTTGVIPTEKVETLERILWRVLRGNLYMTSKPIEKPLFDPKSNKFVQKSTFIIFAHGELILSRVRKICESLDADLYFVDSDAKQRVKQSKEQNDRLADVTAVLDTTQITLETELKAISVELSQWWDLIKLEKSVYTVMNLCHYDLVRKCLIAEGWVPTDGLPKVKQTLEKISKSNSNNDNSSIPIVINTIDTSRTPPTYHKTNKFTAAFQAMVDAYGVATYREVNPALPTAATFPFMFAIMFGDLGHGFIMALVAFVMVLYERKIGLMKRDEIFDMAYTGRYILLLMGVFSMYTGFLYNDLFSISMTWFKSGWKWPDHWEEGDSIEGTQVGVYPIGLDPAWHGTENALLFSNSYKMKLSILMGFIHMTYSYMFSLVNAVHFKSTIDIIGNFIPGLLFMQGIFGYLTVCIVYKWTVDWVAIEKPAPSLLNMLISMFLSPGTVTEQLYPHQATVQVILLVVALICVPCLLLVKPLHFKFTHNHEYSELSAHSNDEASDENNLLTDLNIEDDDEHEEHTFGDVMIHQVIHTIEFCLNCVSHTASYLRLWALSLAHAQLSSVLWSMTIAGSFGTTGLLGVIMTFLMFGMWFVLTVCILVVMEGTSAMLHSLRLHWVESMSKFFEGEGYPYEPYAFSKVLAAAEE